MAAFPFPVDPELTGVVVSYSNAEYVADKVFPRLDPILSKQEFKWWKFDFSEMITLPDTKVGRKGEPGEVEFSASEQPGMTSDYGLDDVVPIDDVNNAPPGYNPLAHAAQGVMDLVLLDREKRVATKTFDPNTYPAANKVTLSGTSQWSNAASDPIAAIGDAADSMIMRPNVLVLGRASWTQLRRNATIMKALSISGTDKGQASLQQVTDLLELDEIVVGSAWANSARKGQAPSIARLWGKHAALIRRDPLANSQGGRATFGFTAQYGSRISGQIPEPKVGLRGAIRVRSGESVAEVVPAADLGFFFQNAVA